MASQLILASSSSQRLELLSKIGITPNQIVSPTICESQEKGESLSNLSIRLAKQKALSVAKDFSGYFVLAADTIVACGRRELSKTTSETEALKYLELLSGRRHKVFGGICLILPNGSVRVRLVTTVVQFKRLSAEEITAYLNSREWFGKAGAYAIQGRAEIFIKRINGSFSNVVGLSLYETMALLKSGGYRKGGV